MTGIPIPGVFTVRKVKEKVCVCEWFLLFFCGVTCVSDCQVVIMAVSELDGHPVDAWAESHRVSECLLGSCD